MLPLRILAAVVGALLVAFGGLFALQGLGLVMWPADSFMLADPSWTLYGAVIVAMPSGSSPWPPFEASCAELPRI